MISAFTKSTRAITTRALHLSLTLTFLCFVACNRAGEAVKQPPTPATPFERGVRDARKQLAKNIFAISRPDGGEITAEDRAWIKQHLPLERVATIITDDNRYVIVSMHMEFPPDKIAALQQRFTIAQVQT
jgi:hypothetical protein